MGEKSEKPLSVLYQAEKSVNSKNHYYYSAFSNNPVFSKI